MFYIEKKIKKKLLILISIAKLLNGSIYILMYYNTDLVSLVSCLEAGMQHERDDFYIDLSLSLRYWIGLSERLGFDHRSTHGR